VNEGDEGEGIWLMDFTYLHEIEQGNFLQSFKWGGEGVGKGGSDLTSVQCHVKMNRKMSRSKQSNRK
jgi:hypothetical protein